MIKFVRFIKTSPVTIHFNVSIAVPLGSRQQPLSQLSLYVCTFVHRVIRISSRVGALKNFNDLITDGGSGHSLSLGRGMVLDHSITIGIPLTTPILEQSSLLFRTLFIRLL